MKGIAPLHAARVFAARKPLPFERADCKMVFKMNLSERRTSLWLVRRRFAEVELHLWRGFRASSRAEVRLGAETEHARIEDRRERFDRGIVGLHCQIEVATLNTDAVLRAFKLRLEVAEVG